MFILIREQLLQYTTAVPSKTIVSSCTYKMKSSHFSCMHEKRLYVFVSVSSDLDLGRFDLKITSAFTYVTDHSGTRCILKLNCATCSVMARLKAHFCMRVSVSVNVALSGILFSGSGYKYTYLLSNKFHI